MLVLRPVVLDPPSRFGAGKKRIKKAAPKTLYVKRQLLNADALRVWAASQGIATALPPEDMHVTIAFSREPVDWSALTPDEHMHSAIRAEGRAVHQFPPRNTEKAFDPSQPRAEDGKWTSGGGGGGVTHELLESSAEHLRVNSSLVQEVGDRDVGEWASANEPLWGVYTKLDAGWVQGGDSSAKAELVDLLENNKNVRTLSLMQTFQAQAKSTPPSDFSTWLDEPQDLYRFGTLSEHTQSYALTVSRARTASRSSADDEPYVVRVSPRKWLGTGAGGAEIYLSGHFSRIQKAAPPNGALVLKFSSEHLTKRWQYYRDQGASWDFPDYQPHVTLTYSVPEADVAALEPYAGPLAFGPEELAEVSDDWAGEIKETPVEKGDPDQPRVPAGSPKGGQFAGGVAGQTTGKYDGKSIYHFTTPDREQDLISSGMVNESDGMYGRAAYFTESEGGTKSRTRSPVKVEFEVQPNTSVVDVSGTDSLDKWHEKYATAGELSDADVSSTMQRLGVDAIRVTRSNDVWWLVANSARIKIVTKKAHKGVPRRLPGSM